MTTNHKDANLPPGRVLNPAFAKTDFGEVIKIEVFPLRTDLVTITFESTNSRHRQGIWLKTDRGIGVDILLLPAVDLWQDTAPKVVRCRCVSSDNKLFLYNIWERDGIRSSLSHSSGMLVDEIPNGRRYRCNDIGFDTSFDRLVFRVEEANR